MDERRQDGGPAFPRDELNPGYKSVKQQDAGMTLRDWFATHAPADAPFDAYAELAGVLQADGMIEGGVYLASWWQDLSPTRRRELQVQFRYAYADAMLAERAK